MLPGRGGQIPTFMFLGVRSEGPAFDYGHNANISQVFHAQIGRAAAQARHKPDAEGRTARGRHYDRPPYKVSHIIYQTQGMDVKRPLLVLTS